MSSKKTLKEIQNFFNPNHDHWHQTKLIEKKNGIERAIERAIKRLDVAHPDILIAPHWILNIWSVDIDMTVNSNMEMAKALSDHMHDIVEKTQSVGLAANQVGVLASIIVFRDLTNGDKYTCINPKITKRDGKYQVNEMCLSLPGEVWKMKRTKRVSVQYTNLNNELITVTLPRRLSLIFQHELDHLEGTLISDEGKRIITNV